MQTRHFMNDASQNLSTFIKCYAVLMLLLTVTSRASHLEIGQIQLFFFSAAIVKNYESIKKSVNHCPGHADELVGMRIAIAAVAINVATTLATVVAANATAGAIAVDDADAAYRADATDISVPANAANVAVAFDAVIASDVAIDALSADAANDTADPADPVVVFATKCYSAATCCR
mmetsp:Transcript_42588/g.70838  ORF Transcript_42588/g.70838 Transcript_42588/m.70838 type:complete len:176 (-) Transcript_42588:1084-1611(-)|eukprot:CAMPEP_0119320190 /NCGR_PEP_ID=MMETSP1333-20130426/51801_1 /TAXON_ID=418940 /ORGANISM="Scyphosphaera apsteinii, Strain RCC1455" /LENGTH=175 /DNA_ID=CAMNT_0007326851 /DNA_START=290 /DNA_END=817 /DNA_ORIENTATION=+